MHTSLSNHMATIDQQQLWAKQLAKNKTARPQTQETDWNLKAASIFQDIVQTKKGLQTALAASDTNKITECTNLLITLRAEQLHHTIEQYRQQHEKENPRDIAQMIFAYKDDCKKLIRAVLEAHK